MRQPLVKSATGLEWPVGTEAHRPRGGQAQGRRRQRGDDRLGLCHCRGRPGPVKGLPGAKFYMHALPQADRARVRAALDEADLFIVVNTDLSADYQVAGLAVKRGVRQRGARLVLVDEG